MDALQKEFWAQLIFSWVRAGLVALATLLEGYGIVTHEQGMGLATPAVAAFLTGLALQFSVALWQYAKTRTAVKVLDKAVRTSAEACPDFGYRTQRVPQGTVPVNEVVQDIKEEVLTSNRMTARY